jgi:hypothetical protein
VPVQTHVAVHLDGRALCVSQRPLTPHLSCPRPTAEWHDACSVFVSSSGTWPSPSTSLDVVRPCLLAFNTDAPTDEGLELPGLKSAALLLALVRVELVVDRRTAGWYERRGMYNVSLSIALIHLFLITNVCYHKCNTEKRCVLRRPLHFEVSKGRSPRDISIYK